MAWQAVLRTVAVLAAVLATGACGLTAPRGNAGFANLDSLGIRDVDRKMNLSIGPGALRFAARFLDDEPEMQRFLRDLDGVRVRIYEIERNPGQVWERMDRMSEKLRGSDWEPVAVVHRDGERTHMLIKQSRGRILGLTVLVSDRQEAVMVNVMGELKPEYFADTMEALDIDAPRVRVAAAN